MHLPLILHWPAGLGSAERRVPGLVEMVDLLPSLTELCGIPRHSYFQGRSYAEPLLSGAVPQGREEVYAILGSGDIMLRTRNAKYILYYREEEGIVDGKQRWSEEDLLVDLSEDPDEMRNVVGEAEYRDLRNQLRDRAFCRSLEASRSIQPRRCNF